ncbi:uncharacterized protein LOC111349933 isoform X2 [Spodoptera litura]|uniref:Uncharacterized protein LOC111349933 isoform X2 n=1 Tax=Spodoptera litura TaxID=69820 RepID=A0A9J7DWI7_SPOLT|nr:uncharacterized protein LOC111349933 isoform X2 [Spodoptera litura]
MAGEGMVAVVRGLRDAGLAVTLLDGNLTAPASTQRHPTNANASTQPIPRIMSESSTESAALHCDRDAQAVDGRYTSMYKTMHCNVRPTSPPVQLTEFPPQRPDLCPGHGNFQVGGNGSGVVNPHGKPTSSSASFRGGLSWPDRGSVCSARPSMEVDAFANSLRKYPCLSPERSSEVMERLINYQGKGYSKTSTRNQASPTRIDSYPCSYHTLESKGTYTKSPRLYDQEITPRRRMEEPTRERKREDSYDMRNMRNFEVRSVRDMTRKGRDNPYCNPACPTIKETQDYQPIPQEYQNSSNSVNMEIQAAVKMISKEVATVQRDRLMRKTVAVPESPTMSATEDNVEGECYLVRKLDTSMSIKSIQTSFFPSDSTLKPRKSAQTIASTLDFQSTRHKTVISRKSKSQEQIKITKEELKRSLLELIEEVSKTSKCKKLIRDELIKKLFESNGHQKSSKDDRRYKKREQCHKYASTFCPTACDYVGDYQELLGQLKHCYGDTQQVLRTEVTPFRISEYKQLDFVLKDWIHNLDIKTVDQDYTDRRELLNSLEERIKVIFKNRTKQDFDLKSAIVNTIEEVPIEVNSSYNRSDYLHRLVDVLMKRMKNVIMGQQHGRSRKKQCNKFKKVLTEADFREFIREHLFDFFNEYGLGTCDQMLVNLENELLDVIIDTIDCIRCGHIEDARIEMNLIFQELANLTEKQAKYAASMMLRDLQEVLNHCNFNHTYMVLNMNNNSGPSNRSNYNESIERITSDDLRMNLDRYANQLCQQINQWLDNLDIPQIQDSGIREVMVNDLAGDIIDRLKYVELNHTIKNKDEDELEALKYQIFKWINKAVGDDNQETIGNARQLLDKIRSLPVPILIHPKTPRFTIIECPNPECYGDPMRPCLGETGAGTCSEINRILRPPKPEEVPRTVGPCCDRETCPEVVKSKNPATGQSKPYSTNEDHYRRGPQAETQLPSQGQPQTYANAYQSPRTQGSDRDRDRYSSGPDSQHSQDQNFVTGQNKPYSTNEDYYRRSPEPETSLPPQRQPQTFDNGYQSPQIQGSDRDKYSIGPDSHHSQDRSFGLDHEPPQAFPGAYQSPQRQAGDNGKCFTIPDSGKGKQFPYNQDQSFGGGQTSGSSNREWASNINDKSDAYGPMGSKSPFTNERKQQSMLDAGVGPSGVTTSPQGAQTSVPMAPGSARPTPLPSIKKIYADYDAYLKDWVQRVPMPMNTQSEKQAADKARMDLYNGVWKTITKMKLDPKIFGNPLYFKEVFNDEIEKLMKNLPKSKQLEIEKPPLKEELLKKTLEMNDLIRSLNVSGTYKQQVIDCIENNSPRRPPLGDETDQQNEEIEKHNVAEYYILHRRYKDDDNVKANFHKKNFLKSLDDYLENMKKRHGLMGMKTYGYANEIINCLDKIPIPNLLALRDEADEILLGMEVENWIADLPQDSDSTGPLDKRRMRDAIVKKIEEVETYVNCYDNAFGDQLKADVPKYIERIPIKKNTNINFVIDELVNRIRNLENMKSLRPRSVSFQDPRDYEDFTRDVPRASSFHDTPGQGNSYYVGGYNADDPRSWASNVPADDQWQSMQATRVPPDLRDWSQTAPSESYAYSRNLPSQVAAQPGQPRSDYGSPRLSPPGQFPPGQEYYNPSAQSVIPPSHPPIHQEQFDPYNPSDVCMGPCCLNPVCVSKLQGYMRPMQYSQPSASPFISPGGYAPGMPGQTGGPPPDAAVPGQLPPSYGHANLNPYSCESNQPVIRCRGPIARYHPEQYQHPVTPYSRVMPPTHPPLSRPSVPQQPPPQVQAQGPQQLQDIPAPQNKRYTLGTSVAPQERRPSEPHVSKGPVQSTSMEKESVRPPISSQGRHSLGHYVQSNPNDPNNIIPDTRRTPQVSAVSPQERRFSEFPKLSVPNSQYTSSEVKMYSKKPVDLQDKRYTEPHIQNIPGNYIDTQTEPSQKSHGTSVSPQESRYSKPQTQSIPNTDRPSEIKKISQATSISPQESQYSEQLSPSISSKQQRPFSETQSRSVTSNYNDLPPETKKYTQLPAASTQETQYPERQSQVPNAQPELKRTSHERVVPRERGTAGPNEQTYVNDQAVPHIRTNRDVSTQIGSRDSKVSSQIVPPEEKASSIPSEGIPQSPLNLPPTDQRYSEVQNVVPEEQVSQLNEQKPPSLLSSAPVSRMTSLDQGSQLPYNQGDSIRLPSYKTGGQDFQAESIPPIYEEPKSHDQTFPGAPMQDPYNNYQYVSSQEPEGQLTYQEPRVTTMGDTEVSYEQPIIIIPGSPTHIIPYDQMQPKGYSTPNSHVVTYEPAYQMDSGSPHHTGGLNNPPQSSEIIPYVRVIESDQTSQPIRYDQISFNDRVKPQSDFVPYSQAIEIEARSPNQVEQYPPNMAYEYIPDSISIEKTRFSPAPVSAASQVPEQILEVYAPEFDAEPGPSATESEEQPSFHKSTDSTGIRKTIDYRKPPGMICDCDSSLVQPQQCICTDMSQQQQDGPSFYVCASGPEGQMCYGPACGPGCPQQPCPNASQHQTCQTGAAYHICTGTSIEQMCRSGGLRRLLTQPKKSLKKMRGTRHTVDAVPFNRVMDLDDTDTSMDRCKCINRGKKCRARKQNQDPQGGCRPCTPTMRYPPRRN